MLAGRMEDGGSVAAAPWQAATPTQPAAPTINVRVRPASPKYRDVSDYYDGCRNNDDRGGSDPDSGVTTELGP